MSKSSFTFSNKCRRFRHRLRRPECCTATSTPRPPFSSEDHHHTSRTSAGTMTDVSRSSGPRRETSWREANACGSDASVPNCRLSRDPQYLFVILTAHRSWHSRRQLRRLPPGRKPPPLRKRIRAGAFLGNVSHPPATSTSAEIRSNAPASRIFSKIGRESREQEEASCRRCS